MILNCEGQFQVVGGIGQLGILNRNGIILISDPILKSFVIEQTQSYIDVSSLTSPHKEYIPGIIEPYRIGIEILSNTIRFDEEKANLINEIVFGKMTVLEVMRMLNHKLDKRR